MPKLSPIGELAAAETNREFAETLAKYTTLNADEVRQLFPKKADQTELIELLKIVSESADDNERKARLTQRIGAVAGAVIKISKRFATGL
jgi:hypothetical protein